VFLRKCGTVDMNQVSGAVRFVVNLGPGWRFLSGGCPATAFQSDERGPKMAYDPSSIPR
jgi:hypothetical protein